MLFLVLLELFSPEVAVLSLRTLLLKAYLVQHPTEVQTNPVEELLFGSTGFFGSSHSSQYRHSNRSLTGKKKKKSAYV